MPDETLAPRYQPPESPNFLVIGEKFYTLQESPYNPALSFRAINDYYENKFNEQIAEAIKKVEEGK